MVARSTLFTSGEVRKLVDVFVVRIAGAGRGYLLEQPGVTCENPQDPDAQRVYRKVFSRKKIFLPSQKRFAMDFLRGGQDVIVLAMTGYSSLNAAKRLEYGIQEGAYEAACADLLGTAITTLQREFPGVQVRIAEGASDMGVDKAAIAVCRKLNLQHLGFSCPEYMFYVQDDDDAVYVARSRTSYSDTFVASLDLLYSVGGRKQALLHDIKASVTLGKKLILLNVLRAISTTGGPQARDAQGNIEDATAAFQDCIFQHTFESVTVAADPYEGMREYVMATTTQLCRKILSPVRAYSAWTRTA